MTKLKLLLTLCMAAGLIAACGDGDDDEGGGAPERISATITLDGKKPKLEAPASVDAGVVEIALRNDTKVPADLSLVRVDGDQTADDVRAVIDSDEEGRPIPDWIHGVGGSGVTAPGETSKSEQKLEPGTYYFGASLDNDSPDDIRPLKVGGDEAKGELSDAPATVTAEDYTFRTAGLKPGRNTVRFVNEGKELHHAIAFPIKGDATIADVTKAFEADKEPPVEFEKGTGTAVIDGGVQQNTEMTFEKGRYAMVCFITDRAGGPPHIAKGMISEVEVE